MKWVCVGSPNTNVTLLEGDMVCRGDTQINTATTVTSLADFATNKKAAVRIISWANNPFFDLIERLNSHYFGLGRLVVWRLYDNDHPFVGLPAIVGRLPSNKFHSEPLPLP